MLPLSQVLNRFPRMMRDLSTSHHKPVQLKLSGTGVLVGQGCSGKTLRPHSYTYYENAFDHGIEPPEIRRLKDKTRAR